MYDVLKTIDTYNMLEQELKTASAPLSVTGCTDSQKIQLVSRLRKGKGWLLYIAPGERDVTAAAEDLKNFNGNVWQYPALDLLFYDSDIHGNFVTNQRVDAVRHLMEDEGGAFVTTIDALMEKVAPRESVIEKKLRIFEGMVISPVSLGKSFNMLGYTRVPEVTSAGEYAVRGGIVDIYPFGFDEPCRLEFFDDEVDTVRSFDILSQRSIDRVKEIEVYPAGDQSGSSAERVSLLSYFEKNTLIVMDNPSRILEKARLTEVELTESWARRAEKGLSLSRPGEFPSGESVSGASATEAPASVESASGAPECPDIFSASSIMEEILKGSADRGHKVLLIAGLDESLAGLGAKKDFHFDVSSAGNYKNSFDMLIADIKKYLGRGYRISVMTPSRTRQSRLAGLLRDYEISAYVPDSSSGELKKGAVEVIPGSLRQGFIYNGARYALFTESDMFGQRAAGRKRRKKQYEGEKLISLNELNYGDYVVHEDHGIGIYKGLEHVVRDGVGKDYIKIEYAGGDNLYLPATRLDLIQKYADSRAKRPKLNKLNGAEWKRTKQKVGQSVNKLAKELVELYAKRLNAQGFKYSEDTVWQKEFEELFPYEETEDQLTAIEQVKADMESGRVMDRLICGDVGYGKTEIALRAAFKAVQDGKQVIFLVPTTILAQQHFNTFKERLENYPVRIEMMSRFRSAAENRGIAQKLKAGGIDIIIGTHRLLSKDVEFKDPGLLIIDEEQRFGVAHKEKIKQMKTNLDVLSLTATPIPRTLHMSLSGIRDLSTLEEPPFDRVPVQTYVMEYNDEFALEAISREVARNGQIFYVFNYVHGIEEKTDHLRRLMPELRIEFAHGQMNERELEEIMMEFVNGEIDVLVSTTIVETGLDIPNANTLIVDGAERMGLSQLYQLRGRVGRSNRTAYAFFMYHKDKMLSEEAEKRLKAIREFTAFGSGIKIAMRDLEIRGAGNVLGPEQHGQMQAVGYDLYVKLLSGAVKLLKGDTAEGGEKADFETTVECDIDAYIPSEYIPDEAQKLDAYKRIAEIRTREEYLDMSDELTDRYGDMPREVRALLDIAMLKEKARRAYVVDLSIKSGNITMAMHPKADIRVEAVPEVIKAENGRLKLIRGQSPRLVYRDERSGYHGPNYMMKKAEEIIEKITK